jgi:hypothetical protein
VTFKPLHLEADKLYYMKEPEKLRSLKPAAEKVTATMHAYSSTTRRFPRFPDRHWRRRFSPPTTMRSARYLA